MFLNKQESRSENRIDAFVSQYRPSLGLQIGMGLKQGQLETVHNIAADIGLYAITGSDEPISKEEYEKFYLNTPVQWVQGMTKDRAALLNRAAAEEMLHASFTKNLDLLGSSGAGYMLAYAAANLFDVPNLISFGQAKVSVSAASRYANMWKRILPTGIRESAVVATKNPITNFVKRQAVNKSRKLSRTLGLLTEGAHVAGKLNLYSAVPSLSLLAIKRDLYQQESRADFIIADLLTSYAFGFALGLGTRGIEIGKHKFAKKPIADQKIRDLVYFYKKRGILDTELRKPDSILRKALDDVYKKSGAKGIYQLAPYLLDPWQQGLTKVAIKSYLDIKRGKLPDVGLMMKEFSSNQEFMASQIFSKKLTPEAPEPKVEDVLGSLRQETMMPKSAQQRLDDFDQIMSEQKLDYTTMTPEVAAEFSKYRSRLKDEATAKAAADKNMEMIQAAKNCVIRNG